MAAINKFFFSEIAKIEKTSFSVGKSLGAAIGIPILLMILAGICVASDCLNFEEG